MALSNYERMIQLAAEVFASKTDPKHLPRSVSLYPRSVSPQTDIDTPILEIVLSDQ
jgi:hypothetical protein